MRIKECRGDRQVQPLWQKIRNPQVVGLNICIFFHGRSGNNGEQAGNFVLYCSEDGIHWDEGRYLKVRTQRD